MASRLWARTMGRASTAALIALVGGLLFAGAAEMPAAASSTAFTGNFVVLHYRSCGQSRGGGNSWKVFRARKATCAQARHVLKVLFSPAAKTHMPAGQGRSGWYTTLPGRWRCGPLEMGVLTCLRGNTSAPTAGAAFVIPGDPFPADRAALSYHQCANVHADHGSSWQLRRVGKVTCAQARRVVQSFYGPQATLHGGQGPRSQQYVTVPGHWKCSVEQMGGVFGCMRGGSAAAPRAAVVWSGSVSALPSAAR